MTGKRREPVDRRRGSSDFVRRAASQGESLTAVPHASLKRRAMGLMKQPLRTDLFRPASQPHDVEQTFVCRTFNFVEDGGAQSASPPPPPRKEARAAPPRKAPPEPEADDRIEPDIGLDDDVEPVLGDDDLDLPPAGPASSRPVAASEALDLPDLDEYDGSDLFDQDDPDLEAEPAIPTEERTELPSALRNRRNYYANSDEARKGGILGGIIPGGGRPAPKPEPKNRPKRR